MLQATIRPESLAQNFFPKMGVDMIRGLRYKLRMIGVVIVSVTQVYWDNMSVIKNTSKPGST
ncbi:hypothetical protein ACHAXS_001653 [Conticribra weissflogii]